jgi:hypothetical protein
MPRGQAKSLAKAKVIDLKKQQLRITLAASSALLVLALLLLIRP